MTNVLEELRHAVEVFLDYPHYYSAEKAHMLAHHKLQKELYMQVPSDSMNWAVLNAMVERAPLTLHVGSAGAHLYYSERDRLGSRKHLPHEGGQLVVCLSRGSGARRYVIEPRGRWTLSSAGTELASGEYDVSGAPLSASKKRKKKSKLRKAYAVVRLPVVGLLGQSRAAAANMPVCELRLKVKVLSDAGGEVRRVTLKGGELLCHQTTRGNLLFAPQASPYAVTGKRFLVNSTSFALPSSVPPGASPTTIMRGASAAAAGQALLSRYTGGDDDGNSAVAGGVYFVRNGEVFFAQEDSPQPYALGTASQAFVNVAVIKNALSEHLESPEAALADPALLDSKLRSAGHAEVADALRELYVKRYGYSSGPSFAQLLTHTSGLPAYPILSGRELVELVLISAGVRLARENEPNSADVLFALRLRNSVMLCGAPGFGYVESALGYALLLLTLPSPASEYVAQVLEALGGAAAAKSISTGLERDAPQFAGVYSLYDSLQMPLSSVAKMLSASDFYRLDKIAGVSVQVPAYRITQDASVTLGGWCVRDMQLHDSDSPQRVLYHVGVAKQQSCVVLVFLPRYNTAAVFGVSPMRSERMLDSHNKSAHPLIVSVARALEEASVATAIAASTAALPALPAETAEGAEAARATQQMMRAASDEAVAAATNTSLARFFSGDTLRSLTTDVTMRFSVAAAEVPDGVPRQFVTLHSPSYGATNTFLVLFDPMYPTMSGTTGAYRVVHPLTQKLGEPLLLQVLQRDADKMPLLSYHGMIFARPEDAQRLTAVLDVKSAEHAAMLTQQQHQPRIRSASGDQSSDEDEVLDVDSEIRATAHIRAKIASSSSVNEPTGVLHLLQIGHRRGGRGGWVGPFIAGGLLGGLAASSLYPYYGYPRPYYPYVYAPPYGYPYWYGRPYYW